MWMDKGAIVYAEKEFDLGSDVEGLVVATSLIGATIITLWSGPVSDWIGRRPMLIASSILYFVSGLVMVWSPNVYVLCLGRVLDGFGIGLAVTLVPLYISETAPTEIRGTLNTLPQFAGSGAMFLSYCMIFGMSLASSPNWRIMLGVLSIPSLLYIVVAVFYLPESPRWLVSKGRMVEAKIVLQKLRGATQDVDAEMALLVEGLGIGGEASIEEYIINEDNGELSVEEKEKIRLYGSQAGLSWVAKPVKGVSRQGSSIAGLPLDPLVTLFGSVHEKMSETGGGGGSMFNLFPNFGSMVSTTAGGEGRKQEQWDEESQREEEEESENENENNVRSPLISRQTTSVAVEKGASSMIRHHSSMIQGVGEGVGGGWQLAWKWEEGKKDGELKRVYLHQQKGDNNGVDDDSGLVQAAALVSHTAIYSTHPSLTASKLPIWKALLEPGIKRALFVGMAIQILQQVPTIHMKSFMEYIVKILWLFTLSTYIYVQFSGINGVLYYTPQILEDAGVEVLLEDLGLGTESASFLISAFTTLVMLPCIALGMRLMDVAGRRYLINIINQLGLISCFCVHKNGLIYVCCLIAGSFYWLPYQF